MKKYVATASAIVNAVPRKALPSAARALNAMDAEEADGRQRGGQPRPDAAVTDTEPEQQDHGEDRGRELAGLRREGTGVGTACRLLVFSATK